jgi:hypothetical protein
MIAGRIIVRLMHEVEYLRDENGRLLIAVRGFEVEPVNPFPLLSGREIIGVLHPTDPGWPR